jgi:hypothetical protein
MFKVIEFIDALPERKFWRPPESATHEARKAGQS